MFKLSIAFYFLFNLLAWPVVQYPSIFSIPKWGYWIIAIIMSFAFGINGGNAFSEVRTLVLGDYSDPLKQVFRVTISIVLFCVVIFWGIIFMWSAIGKM